MEFVEGSRIDAYCDANELSVRDRIQLFLAVCRAVRYAHQNLIVHRDLKPSNIFVTADGEVKLLDFGIAKLLDAAPHPYAAPPTRTAIRLMTPEYASPEQVRGEPVTTASDVYQLGLLLYELLTGHNPQRAVAKNATELEREVSDTEPPRASGETLTSIRAQARRTTPRRIRKLLRGDVDNIIAKALQRNPLRRYASTDPLIEDLERHLDGRPVSARPDSIGYRMGRFMKRHRVGVTVAAIFVLLLGAYGVTITVLFSRVRKAEAKSAREARKATRTADFLTDLFAAPDPRVARSEVPTARDLLDAGAARIQTELADEPEVRAVLQRTMAISYGALGLLDVADSLLEASLEIQEDQLGEGHIEVGTTKFDLAVLRYRQSRLAECKELARGALAIYEKERGPNDQDVASICELLALSLEEDEKEEAEQLLSRSLSIREAAEEPDPVDITGAQYKLGLFYRNQNRPEEAARYYSLALEGRRKVAEPDDPAIATMASALGGLYTTLKRYEEAEPLLEEARSIREKTLGTQHTGYASTLQALGKLRWAQDRHQEALALSREATRIVETNLPDSRLLARYLLPLADLEAEMELYEDAEGHYRQAIGIFQKVAPQSSFHSQARQQLAAMLRQLGRDREADEFESQLVSTRQD
jgi:tetratricopeptide (TPR) repeat protein